MGVAATLPELSEWTLTMPELQRNKFLKIYIGLYFQSHVGRQLIIVPSSRLLHMTQWKIFYLLCLITPKSLLRMP